MVTVKSINFECNGISSLCSYGRDVHPFITTAVSLFRLRHTTAEIERAINKLDPNRDYYFGRRTGDNETLATRITSAIATAIVPTLKTDNPIKIVEAINSFVENLSGAEMDDLIIDAFRDCASSDHWYTFEKQWD